MSCAADRSVQRERHRRDASSTPPPAAVVAAARMAPAPHCASVTAATTMPLLPPGLHGEDPPRLPIAPAVYAVPVIRAVAPLRIVLKAVARAPDAGDVPRFVSRLDLEVALPPLLCAAVVLVDGLHTAPVAAGLEAGDERGASVEGKDLVPPELAILPRGVAVLAVPPLDLLAAARHRADGLLTCRRTTAAVASRGHRVGRSPLEHTRCQPELPEDQYKSAAEENEH